MLEIFVFNINEGSVDNGFLDGYKKLTGDELKNLNEIKIRISAGRKMIYAVANAHEDLKKYATDVILSNDDDGVAKWLEANYR